MGFAHKVSHLWSDTEGFLSLWLGVHRVMFQSKNIQNCNRKRACLKPRRGWTPTYQKQSLLKGNKTHRSTMEHT